MHEFIQRQTKTTTPRIWKIARQGAKVIISHGQQDGKFQETSRICVPVNVGKANEKNAEESAQSWMERQILLKERQGYRPVGVGLSQTKIDFQSIPDNVRFWKPQNSMNKHMEKLIDQKEAWWMRKRDGMMHAILCDADGELQMYSSTMQPAHKNEPEIPWLKRYPVLEASLKSMNIPPNSILLGELVSVTGMDNNGYQTEDLETIAKIVKGKIELSKKSQEEIGSPWFVIWDVVYWNNNPWGETASTEHRLRHVHNLIQEKKPKFITHPEILYFKDGKSACLMPDDNHTEIEFDGSRNHAIDLAKLLGWEGFVAHDPSAVFGDKAISFRGKPDRPKHAVKVKPKFEADFCVQWNPDEGIGSWGKGKKAGGVGSVFAYLWNPDTLEWQYVTKVGGGLTEKDVKEFADPNLFPMVWQVEFATWTDKGSIQFPEFIRQRDDKLPIECTVDQMPQSDVRGNN